LIGLDERTIVIAMADPLDRFAIVDRHRLGTRRRCPHGFAIVSMPHLLYRAGASGRAVIDELISSAATAIRMTPNA
jgi:hypothetical protein